MDLKNFTSAITHIAEEKNISSKRIIEIIETAIAAAYKKDYGKKGQIIKCKLNPKTGEVKFWQIKLVVDESMIYSEEELEEIKNQEAVLEKANPLFRSTQGEMSIFSETENEQERQKDKKIHFNLERHIFLPEAQKINSKIKISEELEIALDIKEEYGRIAAQTAKQVIIQKIREAEKENAFLEYKSKEGEIISGTVQRIENKNVFFDIGKILGFLPKEEQVLGELYRIGQRMKVYILKVEEDPKGPVVLLSRAYPKLVSKLFELEVPEVSTGQVQIKSIAREPGSRSKIAVLTTQEGIDPIGSMVGQKGTRVMAVIGELGGEKIDIIEYSEKVEEYIANSLSPAKVLEVKIMPKNKALVLVKKDQLSLAIGKEGQNVRLAAKLTGWKIDVRDEQEALEEIKTEEKI